MSPDETLLACSDVDAPLNGLGLLKAPFVPVVAIGTIATRHCHPNRPKLKTNLNASNLQYTSQRSINRPAWDNGTIRPM